MNREVSLSEISDGKLYELNDMVKADCGDCKDCSACCQGMGSSIGLDPLDIHRLTVNLHCTFEELLKDKIELNVVDGLILPNLKMEGQAERCAFLNEAGRCSIHGFRPGICRLFPLGRYYENHGFRYFLQIHECRKPNRTKVKVHKWIDVPDAKRYEAFVNDWHYFLKDLQETIKCGQDETWMKEVNLYLLRNIYGKPYDVDKDSDFYERFDERICEAEILMGGKRNHDT